MSQTKFCVVCSEGSPRQDWILADAASGAVACDHHSKEEFQAAIAAASSEASSTSADKESAPAPVAPAKPVSGPNPAAPNKV